MSCHSPILALFSGARMGTNEAVASEERAAAPPQVVRLDGQSSPAAGLEELRLFEGCGGQAFHGARDLFADLG